MELYLQGILIALKGAPATIGVSLFAVVIGAAVGLGFALMKQSRNKLVRAIAKIYIEIVRGTPMIVQALIMAFGIPYLLQQNGIPFKWPELIIPAMIVCGSTAQHTWPKSYEEVFRLWIQDRWKLPSLLV